MELLVVLFIMFVLSKVFGTVVGHQPTGTGREGRPGPPGQGRANRPGLPGRSRPGWPLPTGRGDGGWPVTGGPSEWSFPRPRQDWPGKDGKDGEAEIAPAARLVPRDTGRAAEAGSKRGQTPREKEEAPVICQPQPAVESGPAENLFQPDNLVAGIILSEILQPPKSRRGIR